MFVRNGVVGLLILVVGISIGLGESSTKSAENPILTVRVLEEKKPRKTYVEASYVVPKDGKIKFISGGELSTEQFSDPLQFGTHINGLLQDGQRLSLKIEYSSFVSGDDAKSKAVHGEYIHLQTTLAPGVKKRVHCGGDRWCELTLERSASK